MKPCELAFLRAVAPLLLDYVAHISRTNFSKADFGWITPACGGVALRVRLQMESRAGAPDKPTTCPV